MRHLVYLALTAVAILALLLVAYAGWMNVAPPHTIALGTPIQHDDFFFTVTGVHRQTLPDHATLYRVSIQVKNEAARVDYTWRDDIAYVRALNAANRSRSFSPITHGSFTLQAGEERSAVVGFKLPPDATSPTLRFWDGIFMGDAFNGGAYTKAAVPL